MKKLFGLSLVFAFIVANGTAHATLTPTFNYIAPGWINPPLTISMGQFWSAAGLPDTGTNYYTSAAPIGNSPYWERFNPKSPRYQAWFGCYVVDNFPFASEWNKSELKPSDIPNTIAHVLALSEVDQIAWLSGFKDPSPLAKPGAPVVVNGPDGYFVLYVPVATHSDLGAPVSIAGFDPPYSTYSNLVPAYQPVTYQAVESFKYIPAAKELVIIYASGTDWTVGGVAVATPPNVVAEQFAMMVSTTFH